MNRNRLVIDTMGEEHVSGLIIADEDVPEALDLEVRLHQQTGWTVEDRGEQLRCEKNGVIRWISVRTRPALEDET